MTNTFANKTAERLTAISTNLIGSSRWCKPVSKKLDVVDAWAASKNLTHPYPQASVDRKEIEALFVHILQLAREMGVLKMGTIGLDGAKIHANASRHSALSYEHAGKIEEQLKAEVADLLAKAEAADAAEPPQSSGSAASSAYLQSSDPEGLGRVPEANKRYVADATAVINELASGTNGAVGFFVQFADPENANIKLIVEKGLKVIPVVSRELLRTKVNGQGVYQLQTFTLKPGGLFVKAREETTVCTPLAIITGAPGVFGSDRNKIDDQGDMIEKIRDFPAERLLPQESRIATVIRYAKSLTSQASEEFFALVESTRQLMEERNP